MKTNRAPWALAAALLASCGDYSAPGEVVYGEAVFTQPKTAYDFKPLTKYYLDPDAKVAGDNPATPGSVPLPGPVAAAIDAQMAALGYSKVPTLADAATGTGGVGLKVSVLKGTAAVYYPGYWCDYWYYYYCYYDWYYAGSYSYGTVILEMGDLSAPANGPLPVLWLGAVYGVATSSSWDTSSADVQRIVDGINRAFGQSPYLDTH